MLRFHTQTSGASLTAQQPDNNLVRVAVQAMAAVLGGTQSLHTNSRDEALALPTEESARLALRTQQIIAHESGVTSVADPLGGSEHIERETDRLEAEARAYLHTIDEMGGMLRAIEQGFPQREIESAAYEFQRGVESGQQVVVGVNRFASEGAAGAIPTFTIEPSLEAAQIACLRALRASRDAATTAAALDSLEAAARGAGNLMPPILAAAQAHATVGEISARLRTVFGEYRDRA
jgi:methylmalonyl-CoA mutase N-terminal domain/subunit